MHESCRYVFQILAFAPDPQPQEYLYKGEVFSEVNRWTVDVIDELKGFSMQWQILPYQTKIIFPNVNLPPENKSAFDKNPLLLYSENNTVVAAVKRSLERANGRVSLICTALDDAIRSIGLNGVIDMALHPSAALHALILGIL